MVEIEKLSDATVVTLNGTLGQAEADDMEAALRPVIETKPRLLVIDLSNVTLMASTALGSLLAFNRTMRAYGGKMRLAAPGRHVLGALRFTRIDDILEICGSVDVALG